MVKKIPTPHLKIKKLGVKDLPGLLSPSYRQVMDIILVHIEIYHLQDPNHRSKILVDQYLKTAFNLEDESLEMQAFPELVRNFCKNKVELLAN